MVSADFIFFAIQGAVKLGSQAALVTARQWQRDPSPTLLQRMAASFIEIGIDYFATGPGAYKLTSSHTQ